jgi:hypothetical protein
MAVLESLLAGVDLAMTIEHPELLLPGTKIQWGSVATYTIMSRKDDGTGWWLNDGLGAADQALRESPLWSVVSPAYTQILRVTTDAPQSKVMHFVLCQQCGVVVGDTVKHDAFHQDLSP